MPRNVCPKGYKNGLFSRESPKEKSMGDLQRLSPDGRVKPEAYAGRKMLGLTARKGKRLTNSLGSQRKRERSAGNSKTALKVAFQCE